MAIGGAEAACTDRASSGSSAKGDDRRDGGSRQAWRTHRVLGALVALALFVRGIAVLRTSTIFNDGPTFLALAEAMSQGRWAEALSHAYHPLYSFLISALAPVLPSFEAAGIVLSLIGGVAAVVALYCLLESAYDARVGALGAFMLAVHPYAVRYSADVQSDAVYLGLFLAAAALLFRALRSSGPGLALAAGALSGLAYLTRPEGLGVVVVGLLLLALSAFGASRSRGLLLAKGAALLAGFGLPALPYLLAMRSLRGQWGISQKKSILDLLGVDARLLDGVLAEGASGGVPLWVMGPLLLGLALALALAWRSLARTRGEALRRVRLGAHLLAVAALVATGAAAIGRPEQTAIFAAAFVSTLRPELLLLLGIGVASRVRHTSDGRAMFVAAFQALYAVMLFGLLLHFGYLSRRHMLPPLTLLLGYAAIGAQLVAGRLDRWTPGFAARPRGLLACLLLIAAIGLPKAWHDHRGEELAGRRAAEWLALQPADGGRVAGHRSKLGYYADREFQPLREGGRLLSLRELRDGNVRWVVAEEDALDADLRPIAPLDADPTLELAERHRSDAKGKTAVVFELLDRSESAAR